MQEMEPQIRYCTTVSGLVRRIDPETNSVAETIQLGGDPLSLASDGRVLWVAMHSDALVLRVELSKPSP